MPRRWVWSLLDLIALIALAQAVMLAQSEPLSKPLSGFDSFVEFAHAERSQPQAGIRIIETPASYVVAFTGGARAISVSADGRWILLDSRRIPVPQGANPARFTIRRAAGEVRVVFARAAL